MSVVVFIEAVLGLGFAETTYPGSRAKVQVALLHHRGDLVSRLTVNERQPKTLVPGAAFCHLEKHHNWINTLKIGPNLAPKRKTIIVIFQPSLFRYEIAVNFRECT